MREKTVLASALGLLLAATPAVGQEAMQDTAAAPEITEAVVASDVQDREPMGVDSTFTVDVGAVYFYTVFEGDFDEMTVDHVWMYEGEEVARVPLTVQGPRWRTWSSKEILPDWTGSWTVKVLGADGTEHASVDFTVTEGM